MNALLPVLVVCGAVSALHAQTSPDYLVHHEFLPPSGAVYTNSGATGAVNDGAPSGAVTLAVSPLGVGVTLGGASGDEILCGPSPVTGSQARTVSVWARTSAASGIVTPLTLGTNGFGSKWDMDIDASNGGVLELGVGAGRTTGQGPALNDGQWHMMTAVLPAGATNLGQVRLYVDGAFAYSNSGTRVINTGIGDVIVGRSANFPTTIQFFPGDVDDPVVWSVALSDDEVQALYDVAAESTLVYSPGEFERLLEVYRGNASEVTIGLNTWRSATGLAGSAGLTVQANGRYELVLDAATGAGLVAPAAAFVTTGAGCAGPAGVPALTAPQLPVLGGTLEVEVSNTPATTLTYMVTSLTTVAPVPLAVLGLSTDPTCVVTVDASLLLGPLASNGASSTLLLPIPATPSLASTQLFVQGAVIDLISGDVSTSEQGTAVIGW
ncbi:MAG: LamG-like jellyroll fold domain-containing protein [Planctomycetota bacterium]